MHPTYAGQCDRIITQLKTKIPKRSDVTLYMYGFSLLFQIISYDSPRGGVSVITDKGDEVTASFLVMQYARPSDSGTYSCSPSLGDPVAVNVHVLRGESE